MPVAAPARDLHARLPGYEPSPLLDVPELAGELGIGRVWLKDEHGRFGLPSFKPLGAAWALCCAVAERLGDEAPPSDPAALRERARAHDPMRVVCATDGNHGRAVAHVAALLGIGADVLVPAGTAAARIAAIEAEGARVTVVDGDYDAAQAASGERARDGAILVSDTSWPGNEEIPALGQRRLRDDLRRALRAARRRGPARRRVRAGRASARWPPPPSSTSRRAARGSSPSSRPMPRARWPPRAPASPSAVPGPHTSAMAGLELRRGSR